MSLHLRENAYRGVNAHLHSHAQQHGTWAVFHGLHITHISEALQSLLPPDSGYIAIPEKSLQTTTINLASGEVTHGVTIPDVGVYKSGQEQTGLRGEDPATPGATLELVDTIHDLQRARSVVIRVLDDDAAFGRIVTRIELLSPSNKPPRKDYPAYMAKRDQTLLSGVNLVELDYLHEQRSHLPLLPDYTQREANAYPYLIAVSIPQPDLEAGTLDLYGFRVDEPIPQIAVPLLGQDRITVDFNAIYNHTYASHVLFGLRLVDYAALPANFDAYDAEDQRRIRARMTQVKEAQGGA